MPQKKGKGKTAFKARNKMRDALSSYVTKPKKKMKAGGLA